MTVIQTVDGRDLKVGVPPAKDAYVVTSRGQGSVTLAGNLATTYELIYEENPNCAALVNKLVRQLATLPLRVYESAEDGAPEIPNHPVTRLLNRPAPRRGPSFWKQGLFRSALVHGDGLIAKYRGPTGNGLPTALLPVGWPWVAAYAPLGGPVEWWSTFQTGTQRYFQDEDAIHLAWESGNLHGLGVSPLKQLAATVRLDDASRRYQVASLANGARPGGAIIPPEGFKYQDGQRAELRAEIQSQHGGVDNAFMMALLAPGFTWQPFSHTAVEAEVIAARTLNREEFAMVYDVPPPMIGDLTHGTYSNVEELHRILYVTTLRPWYALCEEILQVQLIDVEEQWDGINVRFDLAEVLRGNRREEIDAAAQAFVNGLMTLNEVREFLGIPKLKDELANVPHIPANNLKPLGASPTDPNTPQPPPTQVAPPPSARALPQGPGDQ